MNPINIHVVTKCRYRCPKKACICLWFKKALPVQTQVLEFTDSEHIIMTIVDNTVFTVFSDFNDKM